MPRNPSQINLGYRTSEVIVTVLYNSTAVVVTSNFMLSSSAVVIESKQQTKLEGILTPRTDGIASTTSHIKGLSYAISPTKLNNDVVTYPELTSELAQDLHASESVSNSSTHQQLIMTSSDISQVVSPSKFVNVYCPIFVTLINNSYSNFNYRVDKCNQTNKRDEKLCCSNCLSDCDIHNHSECKWLSSICNIQTKVKR